ncbi:MULTISPECIES: hypothetical protein [unclassified Sporosarcina]|uniref:hypothetical protein n=1 Tax=unclassified Sporosarcina TaxID=2647733 RepID=UPI001A91351C|nr:MULTISPECIES: hypothetical protein [unclassified Sporosarcina]MBO0587603.1 hypothetical protein [Sporosarcina sp. E16_8]MBO0602408.1 hypothetical protein [Sporosarcina sp. E16_3]
MNDIINTNKYFYPAILMGILSVIITIQCSYYGFWEEVRVYSLGGMLSFGLAIMIGKKEEKLV